MLAASLIALLAGPAHADCITTVSPPPPAPHEVCGPLTLNGSDNEAYLGGNIVCTIEGECRVDPTICWHDGLGSRTDSAHWHIDSVPFCGQPVSGFPLPALVEGMAGDDVIVVQKTDFICPDPTRRELLAWDGPTFLIGGDGADRLFGGNGDDIIATFAYNAAGEECVSGDGAFDVACGDGSQDMLIGDQDLQHDCLNGQSGLDECFPSTDTDLAMSCSVGPAYSPPPGGICLTSDRSEQQGHTEEPERFCPTCHLECQDRPVPPTLP